MFTFVSSTNYWIGANGKIQYVGYVPGGDMGYRSSINTLDVNQDGTVSEDTIWIQSSSWAAPDPYFKGPDASYSYLIRQNNSTIIVDELVIWKFNEDTNTMDHYPFISMSSYKKIVHSTHNLYVAYDTNLIKVSLQDYTYQSILTEGQYEIYNISVDDNDLLQISALRYSDGKKILAQIDNAGVFTVLDEETNQAATILQRLN